MSIPSPRLACDLPEVDPAKIPPHGELPDMSAGVIRRQQERLLFRQHHESMSQPPRGWSSSHA